ncbi:hypothetical protein EDD22DRAFT_971750 [Suillus occidentalis]|nr:hypothetical protein EDD22DRAFT_971750 [Suillus occidentalis]
MTGPEYGGDTLWSSGYVAEDGSLYKYPDAHIQLCFLSPSVHECRHTSRVLQLCSVATQAEGSCSTSVTSPSKSYTLSFVSPGWKSVNVNPGVTRRMLGVPKRESDTILDVLFHQVAEDVDFRVRFHREPNSIAFWDNKVSSVSAQRRA